MPRRTDSTHLLCLGSFHVCMPCCVFVSLSRSWFVFMVSHARGAPRPPPFPCWLVPGLPRGAGGIRKAGVLPHLAGSLAARGRPGIDPRSAGRSALSLSVRRIPHNGSHGGERQGPCRPSGRPPPGVRGLGGPSGGLPGGIGATMGRALAPGGRLGVRAWSPTGRGPGTLGWVPSSGPRPQSALAAAPLRLICTASG